MENTTCILKTTYGSLVMNFNLKIRWISLFLAYNLFVMQPFPDVGIDGFPSQMLAFHRTLMCNDIEYKHLITKLHVHHHIWRHIIAKDYHYIQTYGKKISAYTTVEALRLNGMYIYVQVNKPITGFVNGLLHIFCQAIFWTNAGLFLSPWGKVWTKFE